MSARPKSGRQALDQMLEVLEEHNRCSYASVLLGKEQRKQLQQVCRDKVNSARSGDTEAARWIIEDFVRAVSQHTERTWRGPNHYVYGRYLADALRRILEEGKAPAIMLGIKSSRPGRRRGTTTHDPQLLAAAYWLLHRKGLRPEKCIALLCKLTGADRTTVQSARQARYTKAFSHPELFSDSQLEGKLRKWRYVEAFLNLLRSGVSGTGNAAGKIM